MFSPKFAMTLQRSLIALKQDRAPGPSVVAITQVLQALSDELNHLAPTSLSSSGSEIQIASGAAAVTLKSDGTVAITGSTVSINATRDVAVKATGDVVIKGQRVTTN